MPAGHHLAQVNIARMRAEATAPVMAGLVARTDEMNRLAERSRGFVWRLPGAQVSPDAVCALADHFVPFDPARLFYNLSVWESVEDLRAYVFASPHAAMLLGKRDWIAPFERAHLALWWVPVGHRPAIAESADRLRSVQEHGPTPAAFTFARRYPAPSARAR